VSVSIYQGAYDPAPEGFAYRFVKDGWRGIERYYGPNNDVRNRWMAECGKARLIALRNRYRRGDLAALEEVVACPAP
jgi:hypothetical protein